MDGLTLHFRAVNVPGGLPIRSAPEDADNVVEWVPEGSTLAPLGPAHYDGGYLWVQVRTPRGTDGWTTASGYGQTWLVPCPDEGPWYPGHVTIDTRPVPESMHAELRELADEDLSRETLLARLKAMLLALGG